VGSRSWKKDGLKARMAFEVSSEGELEQVIPLIKKLISAQERVEILYASPSVEVKIKNLIAEHPEFIRCLRMPFIHFFFSFFAGPQVLSWVSAPVLVFCRYDFFPELFLLKFFKKTKLILLSGSLKSRQEMLERPGSFLYEYWSQVYNQFDYIVAATEKDAARFKALGVPDQSIDTYDFRLIQICKRLKSGHERLSILGPFNAFLESYKQHAKILLAQCWPHEMALFKSEKFRAEINAGHKLVVMAPHQLQIEKINELIAAFHLNWPTGRVYLLNDDLDQQGIEKLITDYKKHPAPILLGVPGILCEAYTLFGHAYIGGGFARSIHSVLEPFMAGPMVSCGPKTFRSTEFDIFKENAPDKIHMANKLIEIPVLFEKKIINDERIKAKFSYQQIEKTFSVISERILNVR